MSKVDLIIKGNSIYYEGDLIKGSIIINKGEIVALTNSSLDIKAEESIETGDNLVLPGMVDSHVHLRDPGHPEREDFFTGTSAAAAGGVTTICEHPISTPPPYSPEILDNRIEVAKKKAVVDYSFFGAAGSDNIEQLNELSKKGIIAFKTFLQSAPKGREKEFQGLTMENDAEIFEGLKEISKTGLISAFHAENNDIITHLIDKYEGLNEVSPINHARSRPPITEIETVSKLIQFAEYTGARVLIVHVSTPEAVDLIYEAKSRGVDIYCETCPHYLFLNEQDLIEHGPYAKCNPPLRKKEDNKKLFEQLLDDKIDFIGSDHGPFKKAEKEKGSDNIFLSPAGMANIELTLPLLYSKVKGGGLPLNKMVKVLSSNPAKAFNLYPQKGSLKIGTDADITILETSSPYYIDKNNLFTKAKETVNALNGKEVYGKVLQTLVRGKVIYNHKNNHIDESLAGWGNLITPINNS